MRPIAPFVMASPHLLSAATTPTPVITGVFVDTRVETIPFLGLVWGVRMFQIDGHANKHQIRGMILYPGLGPLESVKTLCYACLVLRGSCKRQYNLGICVAGEGSSAPSPTFVVVSLRQMLTEGSLREVIDDNDIGAPGRDWYTTRCT
jgi:hypothetical protein